MTAKVVNSAVFQRWWKHITVHGRSPAMLFDDSNGAFQSSGQNRSGNFHGLQYELRRRTAQRMFRSGVCPAFTTGNGDSSPTSARSTMIGLGESGNYEDGWTIPGAAHSTGADVAGANTWKSGGGSAFDESILPSNINILNGGGNRYARWPITNAATAYIGGNRYIGCKATPISPFGEYNRPLKAWYVFKKLTGQGIVRPTIRRDGTSDQFGRASANVDLGAFNPLSPSLQRVGVDFTVNVNDGTNDARGPCLHLSETGDPDLSGEIVLYWRYIEDPAVTVGAAVDLVTALGSQSGRESAIWTGSTDTGSTGLIGNTLESMTALFTERMVLCNGSEDGIGLVVYLFGLNDQNETEPSVGPGAYSDGDSPEAYADNFAAFRTNCIAAWTAAGYDPDNLLFLCMPGHALDPDGDELISYFEAIADFASSYRQTIAVADPSRILPGSLMTASGFYDGAGQPHLTMAGYRAVWEATLEELLRPSAFTRNRTRRTLIR